MNVDERFTEAMREGGEIDKEEEIKFVYPSLSPKRVERKPYLYSAKLNASGTPDFVLHFDFHSSPLEVKYSEKKHRDHFLQVKYYSLLMRELNYKVKVAFLYYKPLKELVRVHVSGEELDEVREIIERIKKIILRGKPLRVRKPSRLCINCGWLTTCKPKFEGRVAYGGSW